MINGRLSKFKDQLMEVKTNKEYTAMLKEIEAAQTELRRLEDRLLERMLEADDLAARQKEAEARLADDKGIIAGERAQLEDETARLRAGAGRGGRVAREGRQRDIGRGAGHLRNGARQARSGGGGGEGRLLQRLPRPAAAAGRQRTAQAGTPVPVRELPAVPLLRPESAPATTAGAGA